MNKQPGAAVKPVWAVILAGATIIGVSMGIRQSFGLYLGPVSRDLELGREVFAFSIGLLNLLWGLSAPFAGAIADKYGAGRVVVLGTIFYVIGLYVISVAGNEPDLIIAGVLLGLGVSGTGFTAVLGAVGRVVPAEKRDSALAIASMGGSIGQFAALPFSHLLIDSVGWVSSLLVLACVAALMAPMGWALSDISAPAKPKHEQSMNRALKEALATPGFLFLTAGFFVCGFHVAFVAVHLPAYLSDKGLEPWLGAAALTVIGFANIIGTYGFGRIGQIIEKRLALCALYLARSGVFLILLYMPLSETSVLAICFAIGLLWLGTIPLTSGLVATLFGPRWMSMLFGIVFFSHQIGSFLGAWLGGVIYDAYKSYDIMWWISIALGIVAALLHWPIDEKPVERQVLTQTSDP